ncbi:MAG: RidA family protein [Thermomicrobiales bacterium]|nr:RidA family protein [Thermomicrobiales bacterium]
MTPTKLRLSSGSTLERDFGYSRVNVVGDRIFVSGTTALRVGYDIPLNDPGAQARQTMEHIQWALEQVGSSMRDVVRWRAYITDLTRYEEVTKVMGEFFGDIRPAGTLVGMAGLIRPELLVEIEVDAIKGSGDEIGDLIP